MQYCSNCKVDIVGEKCHCPLCQGELSGVAEPKSEVYPNIKPPSKPSPLLIKLITFSAIVISVLSVMINMVLPDQSRWSLFVVAGAICAWITSIVTINKRRNVLKCIAQQELIVIPLAFFWDLFTGWRSWSITYVYPSVVVCVCIAMLTLAIILKYPPSDYIVYLVFNSVLGIIPIIFILTKIISNNYASLICVAFSIITLAAILIFEWRSFRQEASRKFHL